MNGGKLCGFATPIAAWPTDTAKWSSHGRTDQGLGGIDHQKEANPVITTHV